MANLTRYKQKIFANNSNQVGVFGTGINKVASKNVETLQSSDYENGWSSAIITEKNYPVWQERDGVDYGFSYQLAYLMQKGIPDWLSTETYYQNDFCRLGNVIYYSTKDNNTNHNPTTTTGYWLRFTGNDSVLTNCLLEVPQRIQYTLASGTLTLLQGSVVLIPYGTTDQSSTYTVGSTFINSGLKVADTYWDSTNSRFFVLAELQADLVRAATSGGSVAQRRAFVSITSGSLSLANSSNVTSAAQDSDITQSNAVFYNTTENLVKSKSSGTIQSNVLSFPLMVTESDATYNVASIKQLFNGIGYIGAVIWTDKGLKGLVPNGRNIDGTLNNTEYTTAGVYVRDMSALQDGRKALLLRAQGISRLDDNKFNYNPDTNYNINADTGAITYGYVGEFYMSSGTIASGTFDNAISINSLCDGDWVSYNQQLNQSTAYPTDNDIEFDITDYLPKDSNAYQVLLTGSVTTGSEVNVSVIGDRVDLNVRTDLVKDNVLIAQAVAVSNVPNRGAGNATLFVGERRRIIVKANTADWSGTNEQASGRYNLYLRGYRRVGTNN